MKILKFEADWCNPCKNLSKTIKELPIELQELIKSIDVDSDDATELVEKYTVRGIPTIVFLSDDGKEIDRHVGALSKTLLEQLINKYNK